MSTGATLLRGSFFRTLELFVLLAATFFVTPLVVHSLGDRLYGFWTLVAAVVGYYGFLDIGLTAAAARFLSQALGKDDEAELSAVAGTAFFLFALGGAAAALATALSALACPLFIADSAEAALFQKLILVMGAAAALGFPSKVYSGLLTAGIRYDAVAAISISRTVLASALIYLCLRQGRGVLALAWVSFAVSLLQYGATAAAAKALFPRVKIGLARFETARLRAMLGYGSGIFVCQVGDILRQRVDTLVIAGFLGASLVTPYIVGVRLIDGFTLLVRGSVGMMMPVFSRYEGRGDYGAIRSALARVTKLSTVLSGFVGLSILFYGRAFILRWMGPGFESSYIVAAILCAALIIALPQSPGVQLLLGVSKHRQYAALSLCEGVVNLALSVALLRAYGLYGVALGTLASTALFKLLVQPLLICRAVSFPVRSYLVDSMLAPLLKTIAPLAAYFWLIGRFVAPDYSVLAACVAAQTVLFVPFACFLILDAEERGAIAGALRAAAPRGVRLWPASARD